MNTKTNINYTCSKEKEIGIIQNKMDNINTNIDNLHTLVKEGFEKIETKFEKQASLFASKWVEKAIVFTISISASIIITALMYSIIIKK